MIVLAGLVVYDTLLTFSRELDCIWKRKFSLVMVLFVAQRYLLILQGVIEFLPTPWKWVRTYA